IKLLAALTYGPSLASCSYASSPEAVAFCVIFSLMSRAFGFRMVFGCLYGNNTAKVASVGDGDAAKDINDIGDAKIVDVNVKSLENEDDSVGQEKENNDKNEKALASSIAA
ncbi:hypothetical protein Gotri_017856, partial [Gossypium trilobum]|nr:hypothetical protein [Gossypium trilobum]